MYEGKICRCLLREAGQAAMADSISEYLSLLTEEERTEQEVYRHRLSVCRMCEHLRNGTCAQCGCYVEARAGKRKNACPDVPPRWAEA